MFSIALHMMLLEEEEQENVAQNVMRRNLRDCANPLELPESLFEKHYRVNKPAFQYLLKILTKHSQPAQKSFAVSPIVKLSATLRFFAEGGYQTGVGKDKDVSMAQPTFSKVLAEVVDTFENVLCPNWISFSRMAEDKSKIASVLYRKYSIPSVVGCIDGTHVRIIAPSSNKHIYYNTKGQYSLNVMLVCDHDLKIQYVDASHPGAYHDSYIWNDSELRSHLEKEYLGGMNNYWLLGDAEYPFEPWLLTPYTLPEEGSVEMKFNEAHSKCHNEAKRTIRVLKNRWQCLLGARELHYAPKKAAKITNVCCALHNICIHFKVNCDITDCDVYENLNVEENDVISLTSPRYLRAAETIRNNIANSL